MSLISLPWIVGGPNALGRDYDVIAKPAAGVLSDAELSRFQSYALVARRLPRPDARQFRAFFPLGEDDGPWCLAQSSYVGEAALGAIVVTWGLILSQDALHALHWAVHRLSSYFPQALPDGAPQPLRVDVSRFARRVAQGDDTVHEVATRALGGPMVLRVTAPWELESVVTGVLDDLRDGDRRGASWITSAALQGMGALVPETLFRWVFATADESAIRAYPDHQAVQLTARGVEGGSEIAPAIRVWTWVTGNYFKLPDRDARVDQAVDGLRDRADTSLEPAQSVGALLATVVRTMPADRSRRALADLARAAAAIPPSHRYERMIAGHAVLSGLREAMERAERFSQAPALIADFVAEATPILTDTPAAKACAELALQYRVVHLLQTQTLAALAPHLVDERLAATLTDAIGTDALPRDRSAVLVRALGDVLRGGAGGRDYERLCAALLDAAASDDRTALTEVESFAIAAQFLARARSPELFHLQRERAFGILFGTARAHDISRPLLEWVRSAPDDGAGILGDRRQLLAAVAAAEGLHAA